MTDPTRTALARLVAAVDEYMSTDIPARTWTQRTTVVDALTAAQAALGVVGGEVADEFDEVAAQNAANVAHLSPMEQRRYLVENFRACWAQGVAVGQRATRLAAVEAERDAWKTAILAERARCIRLVVAHGCLCVADEMPIPDHATGCPVALANALRTVES